MLLIHGQSYYHRFFRSLIFPDSFKKYLANRLIKKFAEVGFIIPFIISKADYHSKNY